MAGVEGFEPPHDGFRVHCLTTWLHPNRSVLVFAARKEVLRDKKPQFCHQIVSETNTLTITKTLKSPRRIPLPPTQSPANPSNPQAKFS